MRHDWPTTMDTPRITGSIAHIVWDWNGTLLDDIGACMASINHLLRGRGLPALDHERYRSVFGFPVRDFYPRIGFDMNTEDWDSLALEYHDRYLDMSRDIPLQRGAPALLERLRASNIPMSLLSASEQSILDSMLEDRGISGFFTAVYGLDNLHAGSKLALGRRLIADLHLDPGRTLLIGDTTHDHEVASALGCMCLLVAGGHQSERRLAECNCPLASDLDSVQRMLDSLVLET